MSFDASSPGAVRTRKQRAALRAERDAADLRTVLSTVEGRRLMWRLMGLAGLIDQSHRPEPTEAAFYAGRRDVALAIYAEVMRTDAGSFLQMQAEAIADAREAAV